MIWFFVLFGLLVAVWGGLVSLRWERRVERARRSLAEIDRKRVGA